MKTNQTFFEKAIYLIKNAYDVQDLQLNEVFQNDCYIKKKTTRYSSNLYFISFQNSSHLVLTKY